MSIDESLGLVDKDSEKNALAQRLHAQVLAAATSDNTRRAYRSAVAHFQRWGGFLPADEPQIVQYLMDHAHVHGARTLSLRLTALSQWHLQQNFPDPVHSSTVRKTMVGIGRLHGKPKQKAKALEISELHLIVNMLAGRTEIAAMRDSALIQVGFFGAFRRSELVGINCQDVEWVREGMLIRLPRSKTDQTGEGVVKALPYGEGACCPVKALRAWMQAADVETGPVFRPISRWGNISPIRLGAGSVNTILCEAAISAGVEYASRLASHSMRRGLATSSHRAGASFESIKRQGAWSHDGTVRGYIEEANLFMDNAAKALLQAT